LLIIGIPAYNEEKNIASILLKLKKIADKIIVCNDGSSDLTGEICENLDVITVHHSENLGYGAAIRSIFLKARELEGDVLVTFDADGQHMISDIKNVISPIETKQSDIVIGSRFLAGSNSVPQYRKLGINIITKVTNSSLSEKLTDSQSGFRAYSKDVLKKIIPTDTGMGVSTEILIKSSNLGFKISEVPITVSYEGDTSTHNPVSHGADVLLSTIKYTALERPLRFYGIPAVIFLIIGLSFAFLSIQHYAEFGRLSTNITLIAAGTTLIGVILTVTAVLLFSLTSIVKEKNR
jgi:glycosyltransferase involved in cell wall biosynthesis